jgi:hypothetical protein
LNDIPVVRETILPIIDSEIDAPWNPEVMINVQEEMHLLNAGTRIDVVSHEDMGARAILNVLLRKRMDLDPIRPLTLGKERSIKSRGIRGE